jgi:hypothetical protein
MVGLFREAARNASESNQPMTFAIPEIKGHKMDR